MLVIFAVIVMGLIGMAWLQYLMFGLPGRPSLTLPQLLESPSGFATWLNVSHWVNFFFLVLINRSGFSILVDHRVCIGMIVVRLKKKDTFYPFKGT